MLHELPVLFFFFFFFFNIDHLPCMWPTQIWFSGDYIWSSKPCQNDPWSPADQNSKRKGLFFLELNGNKISQSINFTFLAFLMWLDVNLFLNFWTNFHYLFEVNITWSSTCLLVRSYLSLGFCQLTTVVDNHTFPSALYWQKIYLWDFF